MSWDADALWVGAEIVARLKASVPALRQVLTIDEWDPKRPEPTQVPAAIVLCHALRPGGRNAMRAQTTVDQEWLVLLAVRSARAVADRNSEAVGPLIPQVVKALQGWTPAGAVRALDWRPGPRPDYGNNVSYFPLLFTHQVTTTT